MEEEAEWLKQAAARWERKKAEENAQREAADERSAPEAAAVVDGPTEPHALEPLPHDLDPLPPALDPLPHTADPLAHAADPLPDAVDALPPAPSPPRPSASLSPAAPARPRANTPAPSIEDLARAALTPAAREASTGGAGPFVVPVARTSALQPPSREVLLPKPSWIDRGISVARGLPAGAKWGIAGTTAAALVAVGWLALRAPADRAARPAPSEPTSAAASAASAPAHADTNSPSEPAHAAANSPSEPSRPAAAPPPTTPAPTPAPAVETAPAERAERPARKRPVRHHKKPAAKTKSSKRPKSSGAR